MKLEDQVCSLDLAKRLKELGVKQESYFYWYATPYSDPSIRQLTSKEAAGYNEDFGDNYRFISAFTVAELGGMLPSFIDYKGFKCSLQISRSGVDGDFQMCAYRPIQWGGRHIDQVAVTEADARAKMLIYLIEQGLLKEPLTTQPEIKG